MPRLFTLLLLLIGVATARMVLVTSFRPADPPARPFKAAPLRPAVAAPRPVPASAKEAQHLGTVPSEQAWNTG